MKKTSKLISVLLIFILSVCCFATLFGCGAKTFTEKLSSTKLPDVVPSIDDGYVDMQKFIAQSTTNDKYNVGVIECPYYEVTYSGKANGTVYSYSVPLYNQELHSFGYLEVSRDMLPVTVTLTSVYKGWTISSCRVLPQKYGIEPNVTGGKVTFTINDITSYTLVFNDPEVEFLRPYTLYVKEYEEIDVPSGYELIEYKPGIHYVDRIVNDDTKTSVKSNTFIYLHAGAYLIGKTPDLYTESHNTNSHGNEAWGGFIYSPAGGENIIVKGHGIIDLTALPLHARTPIEINSNNNLTIEGITIINSCAFTLSIRDSVNVKVKDIILMGYKTNSDGIAIINSKDVTVENCFVRSGDDLIEVKAMSKSASNSGTGGSNILFKNVQAWAVKTRCFGFIQESEMDVSGVTYEDCSVIYHDADFTMTDSFTSMGAFVVIVGDTSTISNITFKNCDAYYASKYLINVVLADNYWTYNSCTGKIKTIIFDGMKFNDWGNGIQLVNSKNTNPNAADLSDIQFNNIEVAGEKVTDFNVLLSHINFVGVADRNCISYFNGARV